MKCDAGDLVRIVSVAGMEAIYGKMIGGLHTYVDETTLKAAGTYHRIRSVNANGIYNLDGIPMRCGEAFFSERWVQVFPYEMAPLLCKGTVLRDVGGVTVSYSPSMETYFWGGAVTKSPGFKYLFKQVHATEQEAKLSTACQRVLWAASEASIGWVVRRVTKNGPDDFRWRAPQSVDYYDGELYERVRISKDGTSIDVDVIEAMGEVTDG